MKTEGRGSFVIFYDRQDGNSPKTQHFVAGQGGRTREKGSFAKKYVKKVLTNEPFGGILVTVLMVP